MHVGRANRGKRSAAAPPARSRGLQRARAAPRAALLFNSAPPRVQGGGEEAKSGGADLAAELAEVKAQLARMEAMLQAVLQRDATPTSSST